MTGNGICDLTCEQYLERNFKCTIKSIHAHTWNYLWDEYDTTAEMNIDENDKIVDIYYDQSEVETYHNSNYVESSEFGLENPQDPYYYNRWEEFLEELDFDEIELSEAHAKPWKEISVEQLIKVWRIDLESTQKTLNVTT